jgi:hypothetical protein
VVHGPALVMDGVGMARAAAANLATVSVIKHLECCLSVPPWLDRRPRRRQPTTSALVVGVRAQRIFVYGR